MIFEENVKTDVLYIFNKSQNIGEKGKKALDIIIARTFD